MEQTMYAVRRGAEIAAIFESAQDARQWLAPGDVVEPLECIHSGVYRYRQNLYDCEIWQITGDWGLNCWIIGSCGDGITELYRRIGNADFRFSTLTGYVWQTGGYLPSQWEPMVNPLIHPLLVHMDENNRDVVSRLITDIKEGNIDDLDELKRIEQLSWCLNGRTMSSEHVFRRLHRQLLLDRTIADEDDEELLDAHHCLNRRYDQAQTQTERMGLLTVWQVLVQHKLAFPWTAYHMVVNGTLPIY